MPDPSPARPHLFRGGDERVTHPPPTDASVRAAEDELGVRLPGSYLDVLRVQNGGYLRYDLYQAGEDLFACDLLHGIAPAGLEPTAGIVSAARDFWDGGGRKTLVAIGATPDAHSVIALDYRHYGPAGEPEIIWAGWGEGTDAGEERPVARDFATFIAGLVRSNPNYCYGLSGTFDEISRRLEGEVGGRPPTMPLLLSVLSKLFRPPPLPENVVFLERPGWPSPVEGDAQLILHPNREPEGVHFPEFPDVEWVLECSYEDEVKRQAEAKLRAAFPDLIKLHEPVG